MTRAKLSMVIAAVLACPAGEILGKDGIGIALTADYFGKYIWRGQNLDDDNVLQPGLSISWGDLTVGIWGNMELTEINDSRDEFTELDYSLGYSADVPGWDGVGYSIGIIYYDFPNTDVMDTTEAYWGLSFDLPFSPSVTCFHDLDEAEGTYASLGVAHIVERILELGPEVPVAMEAAVSLGWGSGSYNKYYWGTDQAKLNDLVLSASFPFELGGWTLTPSVNYVTLVSDDIRDTDAHGTDSDFFFAGIGGSKSF